MIAEALQLLQQGSKKAVKVLNTEIEWYLIDDRILCPLLRMPIPTDITRIYLPLITVNNFQEIRLWSNIKKLYEQFSFCSGMTENHSADTLQNKLDAFL